MEEFAIILKQHQERYPLMEPQDFGKLAYQSEFGPEHLAPNPERVRAFLEEEWSLPLTERPDRSVEPIGEGLCRFHLCGQPENRKVELLAEAFLKSASPRGSMEGLEKKLKLLETINIAGMAEWLTTYRNAGCPALRHSETFRREYQPHYRVIETALAESLEGRLNGRVE